MRILHTESSNGWGGQEMRILKEAEGMRNRGHEVIFVVTRKGKLTPKALEKGFTVYELNMKKIAVFSTIFRLLAIIKKHQIQIVNTHSSWDSWVGGIAARLAGKKIIRTRHLSTLIRPGLNSRFLYGIFADFVVTTSSGIIPMIVRQSGIDAENCRCIATGVDPSVIHFSSKEAQTFREKVNVKPEDFLVGTVCVVRSWKGIKDLIKAADLLRDVPSLKWVIVGGGYLEEYKPLVKEKGLEDKVIFTGHIDAPFAAIGALDVFTLLSTAHEGISQASLQASYLEKPLITTTVGGLPEVCVDKETGILVPPFSPEKIAEAVRILMGNRDMGRQMGIKGKSLVLEKFTMEKTLDDMESVYQKIMK